MNAQDKSKDDLIEELQQLQHENNSLKDSFAKEIAEYKLTHDYMKMKMMNCDAVFESSPVAMLIIDETTNIVMVNLAAIKLSGGSESDILQHRPGNALRCVHSSKDPRGCGYAEDCKICQLRNGVESIIANGGAINGAELEMKLSRNGKPQKVWMNVGVEPLMKDGRKLWCIAMNDITEQKEIEIRLKENQTLLNSIIDSTNDMIWSVDAEKFGLLSWNSSLHHYFLNDRGIEIGVGMSPVDLFTVGSEYIQFWNDMYNRALANGSFSTEYTTITGKRILLINFGLLLQDGITFGISIFAKDVTAQKQAELKLLKANRLYAVISQVNQAIVHTNEKDKLFKEICQIAIDFGKFQMAWVGIVDETTQLVKPHSVAGFDDGYLSSIRPIKASDTPEGRGPTGRCILQGKYAVCNDFDNDPDLAIWRDEALKRNFYSAIALPIKQQDRVIGSFTLYAASPGFFDDQEIRLLTEVADDISFALETIDLEQKHEHALTELVEKEEKYRMLTENMKDVVWIMDTETFRFTYVSPSVEKLRGYTPEEVMSQPMDKTLKPEQADTLREYINEQIALFHDGTLSAGNQYLIEEVIQPCKDGSIIHTELVSYLYLNPATGKIELHGVTRDMTERKQAEDKICLSEEKFRASFMTIKDGFYIGTLKEGIIIDVNPGFENIFHYTPEESIGKTSSELGLWAVPEDRAIMVSQLKENGYCNNLETKGRKKNGELFHASITTSILDINKVPHIVGVIRDITERKLAEKEIINSKDRAEESESRLKLATASGQLGIWDWNLIENSMIWDDRMFELYGIAKDTFSSNVDAWINGLHPDDKQRAIDDCNAALNGEREFDTSFRVVHPDGSVLYLKANGSVLRDENGKPQHMIGINRDITNRKQAEEALIISKEHAEESDRLKSAFLANMSHEIRTPLNSIIGFSELLNDPDFDQEQKDEFTKTIIANGNSLLVIISDIMDLSMLESKQIKVRKEEFQVKKLITDLENEFRTKVNTIGLDFHVNVSSDQTNMIIENDYYRIRQVFNNLICNALKFTKNGFIEIGFSAIEGSVEFYVKDTGIGIPSEFHDDIFERFRQVDESKTRKFGGNGLGLAISKNLVEVLGGKIRLESEVGKGSTFFITLPID